MQITKEKNANIRYVRKFIIENNYKMNKLVAQSFIKSK